MSLLSVDQALQMVLGLAHPPRAEDVDIHDALGRVLMRDALSTLTQPPFDAAAMDGYALRSADLPGPLRIVGEAAAGRPWPGTLGPGEALRIFTGAPVPAGADRVVMQEDTARDGNSVTVTGKVGRTHIRPRGNDFAEGEAVPAGRKLSAVDLALLAAMNVPRVTVARAPRVAVLAGGDELVRPGEVPGPGQIISSNDIAVAALARAAGAEAHILPLARDSEESLRAAFDEARGADLVVTIGGASVGDHDLIGRVAAGLGMDRAFHRIAMRPGKPLMAGRLGDSAILGLPGNPVSAIVTAVLFMQPLIRRMQGQAEAAAPLGHGILGRSLPPEGDRQHYLRARLGEDERGTVVEPFEDQDSARLKLMAEADALLVRPAGDPAREIGSRVCYIPLSR
ncbi:gephyrin-like molybdotransferase Glp [Paracoccus chinensis]|uniref:Molybdopterin molybdenumtransferase n=1 Tax=Paracoccus chinensis TaxID=525640 RepID=A0A1G9JED2_9RHOB|nr:gephyrin-like molybdotransferase Glp [Paracoccus chinensis]SDL35484.1 molybdopterin molybdochelatase [Paracoccus chinensis]